MTIKGVKIPLKVWLWVLPVVAGLLALAFKGWASENLTSKTEFDKHVETAISADVYERDRVDQNEDRETLRNTEKAVNELTVSVFKQGVVLDSIQKELTK